MSLNKTLFSGHEGSASAGAPSGAGGKYNPQYAKGSPHGVQPDVTDGGASYQSPMSKKVGKMGGIPTPLAGVVQSPNRSVQTI